MRGTNQTGDMICPCLTLHYACRILYNAAAIASRRAKCAQELKADIWAVEPRIGRGDEKCGQMFSDSR